MLRLSQLRSRGCALELAMLPLHAAVLLLPLTPQPLRPLMATVANDVGGQRGRVWVLIELRAGVELLLRLGVGLLLGRESGRAG